MQRTETAATEALPFQKPAEQDPPRETAVAVEPRQPGRYRFAIAGLLFAAGLINYLDRAALGVAAPFLTKELALSPSALGVIFSTFFLGYSLFAFVGGHLADKYGPREVYTWSAASWSILCAATGLVTGFVSLFAVRVLFGFAEGPMNPTSNRTIAAWFPREETSRTLGFAFSGQTIGSALAAPVIGLLAISYGWRPAFFVVGAAGLLWTIIWRLMMTDSPRDNARVGAAELAHIEMGRAVLAVSASHDPTPLRSYLLRPSTLSLGFGMFAVTYALFIFMSWLPSYLTDGLKMPVKQMAFVAAIPWVCGFVGYVGGGIVADAIYKRATDRLKTRKLMTIVPLACAGLSLLTVNFTTSAEIAVALIAFAVMLLTCSLQSLWATIHELVPRERAGGVAGFIQLLGNLSGIIGPAATGLAVQYLGGYDSVFVIASIISGAGVIGMWLFVRRPPDGLKALALTRPVAS